MGQSYLCFLFSLTHTMSQNQNGRFSDDAWNISCAVIWYQVAQWNGTDDASSVPHFKHTHFSHWITKMNVCESGMHSRAGRQPLYISFYISNNFNIENTLLYAKGSVAFWQAKKWNGSSFSWCWTLYNVNQEKNAHNPIKKENCTKLWGSSAL